MPVITLHTYNTPNGHKAAIMLEETGLAYETRVWDLPAGAHTGADYGRISPIHRIPAIEDDVGGRRQRIFGSGAILYHLAERTGQLMPTDPNMRAETYSWVEFGVSDLAPAAMNLFRFAIRAPEKLPYAIDLFKDEFTRCLRAMETRLGESQHLAGPDYTIGDIACLPFTLLSMRKPGYAEAWPNLARWCASLEARPAVQRGLKAVG
ncbi:MAG: glutathione S-transferase family protein [Rhodospirillales bacterium]